MSNQVTNNIVMIRPARFYFNCETAVNNHYQNSDDENIETINERAVKEFDLLAKKISEKGVKVNIIQDTYEPSTPDSVFPNNWFSSHDEGILFFYPMFANNRREELKKFREKLYDIIKRESLKIVDYSLKVNDNIFLEGTGSIVLDRKNKKAYCSLSQRSDEKLFKIFCKEIGYKPVIFSSFQDGEQIYHTNVMMSIGENRAIVCFECIPEKIERENLRNELEESGKEIIEISLEQVKKFLGNTLELMGENKKRFIVMSKTAYDSLNEEQKEKILKDTEIVYSDVKTIEFYGGGSARCMIGEIF
ncbi:citrulline utilization hydrolase CtlX [Fusobacterium sp.]|uniref:citrulline utilization hydrolase CtlX n=1 Tax=Fusobacterium sp. TaxID=68766 RepID=UPI002601E879|nr:arginine deiminase-related protein [Fusobacterium sp.]